MNTREYQYMYLFYYASHLFFDKDCLHSEYSPQKKRKKEK